MPLAASSTKSIISSTNAWRLFGTPEVAPRTTHQTKPSPMRPRAIDVRTESTFSVQKPPSPTGFVRNVRWCWMYSEGVSSAPAAIRSTSVVAYEKRHREYQKRHYEARDER